MGLADFLAQVGQGSPWGSLGQAFGGQTTGQRNVDDFVNQQLPALVDQIHKAGSRDEITNAGQALITTGLKAGIPAQNLDKLMEMTIGPALQNLRSGEIDKFREDLRGQQASPRPQGGPDLVKGPDIPAIPGRQMDPEMAVRLGQITGANAPQMLQYVGMPAELAAKQASTAKTQGEIDKEARAARQREGLSNVPQAPGQPSMQDVGILNPAGLQQFLPNREKPEDPLLEERRALINAQTGAANSLAANRAAGGGAGGQGTTTESPHLVTPAMQADAGRQIAQAAKDRGMTSPEQIKQIADDFGYTIEGNPTVEDNLLSAFGVSNAKLGGTYRLTPKGVTKTVTKGAAAPAQPSGQGRYSEGVPTGSAPASQAGGRGRGQAPSTPKRLKFDAQGNQIQ